MPELLPQKHIALKPQIALRKAIQVQYMRFAGTEIELLAVAKWVGKRVYLVFTGPAGEEALFINTSDPRQRPGIAHLGDYIIKSGDIIWPVSSAVFAATYDIV